MDKEIIVTVPNLKLPGGVSAFWNALLPEFDKMKGVHFRTLEIGGHGKNVLGPLLDLWNLKKSTETQTDLVILNPSLGSRSFFRDAFFARYLNGKKISFVVFFHGWDLNFEKKIDEKHVGFFQGSFGKAKKIFVLSSDFKNKLLKWGYQGEIIVSTTTINSNLLEETRIERTEDFSNRPFTILFLSRLLREKGIYETIDAFEKLLKKHRNIQLVIAGNGEEFKNLRKLVGNNPKLFLAGHVEGHEKINLFKQCDIYCLPSYSEGLPTSVLEAMSFGKPVVTTAVGGLKDFFQDGNMGYFVKPKNSDDLEEKLRLLLTDGTLREKIGDFNYAYAHEHVMSDKVAKKMFSQLTPFL
ncbi:glycosyltransferase [Maribacter sp. X9]|uniref:glycosyltransferase n=1 Tax=Maribacter sp. X9 TaxID=3402159 RepID=UPI003AF33240